MINTGVTLQPQWSTLTFQEPLFLLQAPGDDNQSSVARRARYTALMATANDIYRELLALPEQERLQLVERVTHDLVAAARHRTATRAIPAASSVIGLWADEPEVADQIIERTLQQREARRLRTDGALLRDG